MLQMFHFLSSKIFSTIMSFNYIKITFITYVCILFLHLAVLPEELNNYYSIILNFDMKNTLFIFVDNAAFLLKNNQAKSSLYFLTVLSEHLLFLYFGLSVALDLYLFKAFFFFKGRLIQYFFKFTVKVIIHSHLIYQSEHLNNTEEQLHVNYHILSYVVYWTNHSKYYFPKNQYDKYK